jgi:hypothetical protein
LPPYNETCGIVGKFAAGVIDTGGKFATVVDTSGKFAVGVVDTGGAPCKYLCKFSKNFEMTLGYYQRLGGR